jgi:hypothetical protein
MPIGLSALSVADANRAVQIGCTAVVVSNHGGRQLDGSRVPTIEPHDDEGIEQVEANGRNNKQVHGGNVWSMIAQEGSPSLAGWSPSFNHVLGDARLRDFKTELEQFAVDTWRAPKRIFDAHSPDHTRSSVSTGGRPPRRRDFQRQ